MPNLHACSRDDGETIHACLTAGAGHANFPAMESVDCIVVGAGVVGLAVARALAMAGREVIVLEAADAIGTGTSSRNSEVIHAGIYYAQGSLKAKHCVAGKHRLYEYCETHGVGYRRCGKFIVATSDAELAILDGIKAKAAANGVDDLTALDSAAAQAAEPALRCTGAMVSPSTGIVDSHGVMLAYQGEAEDHGAMIAFHAHVDGGWVDGNRKQLTVSIAGGEQMQIACDLLVNAAGLGAQPLSNRLEGLAEGSVPPLYYCKGSYFSLLGRQPFSRLIYPVPDSASLGVHVTVDLAGQVRFGPDQEWVEDINYDVEPSRADVFYDAVRKYYPALQDGALQPAYSGMRPKIQAPDEPGRDFMIQGPDGHGINGMVNLYGIESPGLTASLSIAEDVAALLLR